jgi:hypothetical protein
VAEELALEKALGDGGAADRDERARRCAVPGDAARAPRSPSRCRSRRDEHGRVGLRDAGEEVVHLAHGRARADEVAEAAGLLDRAAQTLHLGGEAAVPDGPLERHDEELELDRLGDEVVGAGADRADGRLQVCDAS